MGWPRHSSVVLGATRPKIPGRKHHMVACKHGLNMSVASLIPSFGNLEANKRGQHSRTKPSQAIKLSPCFSYGFFSRPALAVKLGLSEKGDPEEDPCGGWPSGDLPFYRGLLADMPCNIIPLSMERKIIICMGYNCVHSQTRLTAFNFIVKV